MPFTANHALLQAFCHRLETMTPLTPLQSRVRAGMQHILNNSTVFNACVSSGTPFFREFFATLTREDAAQDDCFALFECLVIFFREKSLRMGRDQSTGVERAILEYFETSEEWSTDTVTLISRWYWKELPQNVASSLRRERREPWNGMALHPQAAL